MYQIDFHKPIAVHFIGIGGISMSGLAEVLLEEGFTISGSDSKKSPLTTLLESKGATLYYGQRASNIKDSVDVVVYTAATIRTTRIFLLQRKKESQCSPGHSFSDRSCATTIPRSLYPELTERLLPLP